MEQDRGVGGGQTGTHLVVLVHGIRTRASWQTQVQDALLEQGFKVALSNYGRFGLVRFLLPIQFFKSWAATDIERDLREAMRDHGVDRLSVIAHSFGTFGIGWLLRHRPDIQYRHIIFCGSVLPTRFPFQFIRTDQFQSLINEVGTRDIWPILAENITWGYGSTGAFGFRRPRIYDRYHHGVSHSAFLTANFCRHWWIPILSGNQPEHGDKPERPPWWLRVLDVVHVKYSLVLLLAALAALIWTHIPERKFMLANIGMDCYPVRQTSIDLLENQPAIGNPTPVKDPPAASHLMVVISSADPKYIQDIRSFLQDKNEMKSAKNAQIEFVGVDHPVYDSTIGYYKQQNKDQTRDLSEPDKWIAYMVPVPHQKSTPELTSTPVPTRLIPLSQVSQYVV
jgi:pimeloyl-ACP methyl ester carboxylesterase